MRTCILALTPTGAMLAQRLQAACVGKAVVWLSKRAAAGLDAVAEAGEKRTVATDAIAGATVESAPAGAKAEQPMAITLALCERLLGGHGACRVHGGGFAGTIQAFVPFDRQNYLIMSADYSQIELRLLAHVSGDENLINAFKSGIDVHTLTASKVFEVPVGEVTKEMRYKSKAVNFGIVYGQSKYGLAKALKITPYEAESFINKYFETYPKIQIYMQAMVELVQKQEFVETIFGRKRYLANEINSPNGMIREFAKRAAINHPMQGSASD